MTPAGLLITLPELQKLQRAGYCPIVLREIEDHLVMQATEIRFMQGQRFDTREELISVAANLLPRGDNILVLYKEIERSRGENSAEELSMLSEHIERAAYDLEYLGAKALAARSSNAISEEKFASAQTAIGRRYADLLDAAERVESIGGPASIFGLNVLNARERPEGPLGAFYDSAVADLALRSADVEYQRMRGSQG